MGPDDEQWSRLSRLRSIGTEVADTLVEGFAQKVENTTSKSCKKLDSILDTTQDTKFAGREGGLASGQLRLRSLNCANSQLQSSKASSEFSRSPGLPATLNGLLTSTLM